MTDIAGTLLATTSDLDGNYSVLVSVQGGVRRIDNLCIEFILALHRNLRKDNYVEFSYTSEHEVDEPIEEQ